MTGSESFAGSGAGKGMLVLGVDTCGPSGTVALARIEYPSAEISKSTAWEIGRSATVVEQITLEGRTYSTTLVSGVEGLLTRHGVKLADLGAIVVAHGPGSFTGIRVGVSAVKGLAEPGRIPVVAVSRLAVLAAKAGVGSAALDAHRHEVFLRVAAGDGSSRQLLAGAEELAQIYSASSPVPKSEGPGAPSTNLSHISESRCGAPGVVAVCDDAAAAIVEAAWGGVELRRVEAPTAADAIRLCAAAILAGEFADLALLDGYYLRRSDAEIFGESAKSKSEKGAGIRVRRMEAGDIDAVMEIASKTEHAPRWGRSAYEAAIDAGNQPRRVALAAERDGAALAGFVVAAILPGNEAELESIVTALPHQTARGGTGAVCGAQAGAAEAGCSGSDS